MYLLDANILIEAKDRYYGMDFAPGFWDWVLHAHGGSRVFSVDAVRAEVEGRGDELAAWSSGLPNGFYLPPTGETTPHLQQLSQWATSSTQYRQGAKNDFLASADYRLVAQAKELDYIVVTHEKPAPDSKKKIKIPEACDAIGAKYCDPWQVLRSEGARLVTAAATP